MVERVVKNEQQLEVAVTWLKSIGFPLVIDAKKGGIRSVEQNRLQRLWLNEAADQLQDETAEEKRGYCKLMFGIPIMCEDERYHAAYTKLIQPWPYEHRIELMMLPIDYPVTRGMTVRQKSRYLNLMRGHFESQGVVLTIPDGD